MAWAGTIEPNVILKHFVNRLSFKKERTIFAIELKLQSADAVTASNLLVRYDNTAQSFD